MTKKNTAPVKTKQNRRGASSNVSQPKDTFGRKLLVFVLVCVFTLSALAGTLFILDKQGKLENLQNRFRTDRSTNDRPGKYYKQDPKKTATETEKKSTRSSESKWDVDEPDPTEEDPNLTRVDGEEDLAGYTIILDAGHGGRDTGAVYPFNNPKYHECDFNLRIAKQVQKELESRGAEVYMLRTDDSWVSLYGRVAQVHLICLDIAEREGKLPFSQARADELREMLQETVDLNEDDIGIGGMGIMVGTGVGEDLEDLFEMEYQLDRVLFLSIHLNSNEHRTLHGTQLFYVTDESVIASERNQMNTNSDFKRSDFPKREEYYGRHNEDNELLACCMYDNIVGNIPEFQTNATPVNADNYAVLREHGLTGVLIEVAFICDDNDLAMLQDDETIETVAVSISDGAVMYFHEKGV